MVRPLYLATLSLLQLALVVKFAPPLAQALRADALPGLAPDGWPAMLQFVATSSPSPARRWPWPFRVSRRRATAVPGRSDSLACRAGPSRWRWSAPRCFPPPRSRSRWHRCWKGKPE